MIVPAAVFGLLAIAVTIYKFVFAVSEYDNLGLPLAGEPDGAKRFSLKSRLRYYYDCAALYTDAYYRFGKHGKAALVPGYGGRADLILPESSTEWTTAQPDSVLSVSQAFLQANLSTYSLGHSRYWGDPWQFALVKTQLNNMMNSLIPAVDDELHHIVPLVLGTDTSSWKEIHLDEAVRMIVAGSSSRFTVGLPLCRNEDYLKRTLSIIDGVMITAIVGNCLPGILLPVAARLASLHTWRNLNKIKNHIIPQYHERLAALEKDTDDQPQDQLQVMLRFAQKKRPQEVNDLGIMATRLAASNFVSMHQTAGTAVQMLLNIIDSDPEFDTIAKLRAEADRELGPDGAWTKEKFQRMHGHDSVARESMRVTFPFGNRGLLRKVMKDDVVTDGGIPLKRGTIVAFLASQAQRDPAKFSEPDKFDPWRFSRPVEKEEKANGEAPKAAYHKDSFVSTSPDYLPFGHGRHACPGRFLVDFELKMIVAYILKHYDIEFPPEYKGQRPPNRQVAELQAPPAGVKIRVKRRA
ncbi:cytochrome P450 [Aspergillus sclerotioniger CBS 115572]|uniref:Cytochrome P450 n=1 Tax=Aspergillus sclerotioniger CBS 115572 TaxID=1450535 RepID=A0A317XE12_9EURO|nr:cytochrome P450 [Aspergillus sclerotioniger CBS 115572]PWY94780.1 cytochrome P450 [Aspergillus sclerotioniger CBS 115572]